MKELNPKQTLAYKICIATNEYEEGLIYKISQQEKIEALNEALTIAVTIIKWEKDE
jgi:hypothetical protein